MGIVVVCYLSLLHMIVFVPAVMPVCFCCRLSSFFCSRCPVCSSLLPILSKTPYHPEGGLIGIPSNTLGFLLVLRGWPYWHSTNAPWVGFKRTNTLDVSGSPVAKHVALCCVHFLLVQCGIVSNPSPKSMLQCATCTFFLLQCGIASNPTRKACCNVRRALSFVAVCNT